jgi:hypothetical protein
MKIWTLWLLVVVSLLDAVQCWDNEELEIFDLVEEVNTNFYTLLGVTEVSDQTVAPLLFLRQFQKDRMSLGIGNSPA